MVGKIEPLVKPKLPPVSVDDKCIWGSILNVSDLIR
jgi:hypothetical protein